MAKTISLSALQESHRMSVDVFKDGELIVDFLATRAGNKELISKFNQAIKDEGGDWISQIDGIEEYLVEVVSNTNIVDDKGNPVPMSKDLLDSLGVVFTSKIFSGIMETFKLGE